MEKIHYRSMNGNVGLAKAIDIGCLFAIKNNFDYVLTMDQDSLYDKGAVIKQKNYLTNHLDCGLVAPNLKHIYRGKDNIRDFTNEIIYPNDVRKVDWVITSGSMFRQNEYKKTGGVDKKLFIGQIDQDYCCKINNKLQKNVIQIGNIFLHQEAGEMEKRKIFIRLVHVANYNPIRYYYVTRNEIYLRRKWGDDWRVYKVDLWKYLVLITLFEKCKIRKYIQIIRGVIDGMKMKI